MSKQAMEVKVGDTTVSYTVHEVECDHTIQDLFIMIAKKLAEREPDE